MGGVRRSWCWGQGAEVWWWPCLAEVGPVTLTTDPQLFQQRLRELHVQVGTFSPTLLCQAWLGARPLALGGKPGTAWWWVPGAIPASPTSVMGVQAEPNWLGVAHRGESGEDG